MRTRPRSLLMTVLVSLFAASCTAVLPACESPGPAYDAFLAASDVAVNRTMGPRLEAYYAADTSISVETRASYMRELRAFRSVIESAKRERAGTGGAP